MVFCYIDRLYRVNCFDCTQRTNAVMIELSKKGLRDLEDILCMFFLKFSH